MFQKIYYELVLRYYYRKQNILSYKSGVEIDLKSQIGKNCNIWHSGVVINGIIGDNCTFHGNNIIGNKGKGKESLIPKLGNNVDVGVNAVVIGGISIANNCIIGAGAVVTKDYIYERTVIAGVPAKKLWES